MNAVGFPTLTIGQTVIVAVLVALCASWSLPGSAGLPEAARSGHWVRLSSPNFTCYTNADQQTVSRLLRDLERLREVVATGMPEKRSPVPIRMLVFRDPESFAPYNLRRAGSAPAGYFAGGMGAGYLAFAISENLDARRLIYHEFIHSLLFTSLPSAPLWLNEGLAEFYSTFESTGLTAEIGLPIASHLQRLRTQPFYPLETLFTVTTADPRYTHESLQHTFYAQSWLLAHMLAVTDPQRFVAYLGGDTAAPSTLQSVYGRTAPDSLGKVLATYLQRESIPYERYRFQRNYEDLPVQAYAAHRKEILTSLGNLLVRHQPARTTEAREHFRTALGLDAGYAEAVYGLGLTYQVEGRQEEADSLFTVARELGLR